MGMTLSSLIARVTYIAKTQSLKNGPHFDRFKRPPKLIIFKKKSFIVVFWVVNHFYLLRAQLFKKKFFRPFLNHPTGWLHTALSKLNVRQGRCEYLLHSFWFDPTGN